MFQGKAESSIEKDANLKNASFSIFIFIFYKSTVCLLSAKPWFYWFSTTILIKALLNKGFRRCSLASIRGFEPPTPRLGGVCSIQLSYWDIFKIYAIFTARRNRTICRLGGECSIQLSYDDTCRKPLILLGFWDFSLRPYIRLSTLFRVVNLQIFLIW